MALVIPLSLLTMVPLTPGNPEAKGTVRSG